MLRSFSLLLFLWIGSYATQADPTPPPGPKGAGPNGLGDASNPHRGRFAYLTPAEREQMRADQEKAFADNPTLRQEDEQLKSEHAAMRDSSPTRDEQMAYREKMRMHMQKMREAMLKEDPSVAPIIQKIEQHMSQERAAHDQQMPSPGGAPSSSKPPVAPPVPAPSTN